MKVVLCFKHTIENDKPLINKINAALVKFWCKSKYYHVEIVVDGKWITSNNESGVGVQESIFDKKYFDFFELEVPDMTAKQKKLFWKFIMEEIETGYDWFGIFASQFLFLDNESEDKWFCSEIVTKVLQMLYYLPALQTKPSKQSPGSLFRLIERDLSEFVGMVEPK